MRANVPAVIEHARVAPGGGARRRGLTSQIVAAAAVALLCGGDAAYSQSREQLIGTFGGPRAGGPGPGTYREPRLDRARQAEIDRLLEDARDDLMRGRPIEARHLLETVIERHSGTAGADEARRLLAPIYAAEPRPAQPGPSLGNPSPHGQPVSGMQRSGHTERAPAALPSRLPVDAAAAGDPPSPRDGETIRRSATPMPAWSTEIRRVQALDREFRASVGDRVFFGDASFELGSKARAVLTAQAVWLKRFPQVPVTIEAHADDNGSSVTNADLSTRRGEAVRARLIEEGIEPTRIRLVSHGREKPVAPCLDAGCAAQNRRVITLIGDPPELRSLHQGAQHQGAPHAGTESRSNPDPRRRN